MKIQRFVYFAAVILTFFYTQLSNAQNLINITSATTCSNSLEISTTKLFGPTTAPGIRNLTNESLFSAKEVVAWYKFSIEKEGVLLFDIVPLDTTDNYDFLLFKGTSDADFCNKVMQKQIKPVSQNFNKFELNNQGKTGLSINGNNKSYSRGIEVNKGEIYYLALNSKYDDCKGHTISFKYLERIHIKGKIFDKKNGQFLPVAVISWENSRNPDEYFTSNVNKKGEYELKVSVSSEAHTFPRYTISAYADGYFMKDTTILSKELAKIEETKFDFELTPIKAGYNYDELPNMYFEPNENIVVKESERTLKKLIKLMNLNKNIEIICEGHTNGFYPSTEVDEELSENRAEVIKNYLISYGISADRIQIKALGCTKLLYPLPENEIEEGFNRRVEINITKY